MWRADDAAVLAGADVAMVSIVVLIALEFEVDTLGTKLS